METPRDRDDQLSADLRALRPTPRPEFAAELDQRAAASFPRRSRWLRVSFDSLRAIPARKLLVPVGGVAVIAVAIVTAVVALQGTESRMSVELERGADSEKQHRSTQFDEQVPVGGAASQAAPEIKRYQGSVEGSAAEGLAGFGSALDSASADYNSSARLHNRSVERSAELVLGAAPAAVAGDSSEVFEAVHAHDGIVLRSSTREGEPGIAGARFELLIPSAKLGDALAALSAIDEVRSRHEATDDITAPTVAAGELLQDSKARIDSLLAQLEAAETESEREAVEAELAQERRHRSRLRAQLQQLERRADYSRVLVRIETGDAEESSGGGAWGVGDALDDAGQILAVAAALSVVALAILGPIALIALLAWLAHRAWVRRERRRVLS